MMAAARVIVSLSKGGRGRRRTAGGLARPLFARDRNEESDPLHERTDTDIIERIESIAASIGIDIQPRAVPGGAGKADGEGPAQG